MMGRVYRSHIKKSDITDVAVNGYEAYFLKTLSAIDELDVYDTFRTQGWNWRVARLVNKTLLPMIISAVVLGWYAAVMASEQTA